MIEYYKRTISQNELKKIEDFKVGSWINVIAPNHDELALLAKNHNLDIELLEEGLDDNELPRIDFDQGNNYIYVKSGHKDKNKLLTILIVIGEDFILTLSKHKVPEFDLLISKSVKIVTTQRLKTLISMLYLIDQGIEKDVLNVVKTVQQKKKSSKDLKEKDIDDLLDFEDYLNNLVSMYYYTSLLYSKLTKHLNFLEDDRLLLQDLIVETEEGLNLCKNSLKTISNIRNNYSIVLSNKLNRSIQILTLFTIAINIPAAIGGIYGMNIGLPFQNSPFAFIYVMCIIAILITSFFIFAKKKRLI
mgnify:CR=1 FL=1